MERRAPTGLSLCADVEVVLGGFEDLGSSVGAFLLLFLAVALLLVDAPRISWPNTRRMLRLLK